MALLRCRQGGAQALQEAGGAHLEAGVHVDETVERRGEGIGLGLHGADEVREGGDVVAPEVGPAERATAAGSLGWGEDLGEQEPPPARVADSLELHRLPFCQPIAHVRVRSGPSRVAPGRTRSRLPSLWPALGVAATRRARRAPSKLLTTAGR